MTLSDAADKRRSTGGDGPLRVIVNDRPLRVTLTGVGHYLHQLLLHLDESATDIQADPFLFTHVFRRDWRAAVAKQATPAAAPGKGVGTSRKPWWLRKTLDAGLGAAFRLLARRSRYALYHEPNHVPIRCDLPTVTTIHDLSVLVHPEWHPSDRVRWYETAFDAGLRQTTRFIAASEFTRQQLVAHCGVAPDRVDVTYQAPRAAFQPGRPTDVQTVLRERDLTPGYFLYVGTLEPRKNVDGLLDAYGALPATLRGRHPLVIVGAWGWKAEALQTRLAQRELSSDVRLLGYATDAELATLYTACQALVWPTWYEGFGLPPLEAMACGAPVVVSDVASLPEVVGDAGVRLEPQDTPGWTAAMRRMAEDEDWRADRAAAGRQQAARFSWPGCAAATIACYRAALRT